MGDIDYKKYITTGSDIETDIKNKNIVIIIVTTLIIGIGIVVILFIINTINDSKTPVIKSFNVSIVLSLIKISFK